MIVIVRLLVWVSSPRFSPQLVGQLCSTLGMHHWENGQIAIAMQWFRRAGDTTRAKALVEHLMSVEQSGRLGRGTSDHNSLDLTLNTPSHELDLVVD